MDKILQDARHLWEQCFPEDESTFLDFYFDQVAKAEDTYIEYNADKQPTAHIGILRYGYKHSEKQTLAYVSGACTLPQARQQGLMKQLMTRVIREEKLRGSDALILIPANPDLRNYYNKHFGFRDTAPYIKLNIEQYVQYLYRLSPPAISGKEPSEALKNAALLAPHITYSLEQARVIISEYESSPIGLVHTLHSAEGIEALLLARRTASTIYVDYLSGDTSARLKLLDEIKQEYSTCSIEIQYIFPNDDAPNACNELTDATPQAWGMVLDLRDEVVAEPWDRLGISLVHN